MKSIMFRCVCHEEYNNSGVCHEEYNVQVCVNKSIKFRCVNEKNISGVCHEEYNNSGVCNEEYNVQVWAMKSILIQVCDMKTYMPTPKLRFQEQKSPKSGTQHNFPEHISKCIPTFMK